MTGNLTESRWCSNINSFRKELLDYNDRIYALANAFITSHSLNNWIYKKNQEDKKSLDRANYVKDFIEEYNKAIEYKKEKYIKDTKLETKLEFKTEEENKKGKAGFRRGVIIPLHRSSIRELSSEYFDYESNSLRHLITEGCLILNDVHLGKHDLDFLNTLTDLLATKLAQLNNERREKYLLEFAREVDKKENRTEENLLHLVRMYLGKVMFSENMYIALLDESNNINFPVLVVDGKHQTDLARMAGENRKFDLNSTKKGRTETILAAKKGIFIETLSESRAWYDSKKGREEKIGNPFASWIGVPLLDNGVPLGVISVYHPEQEYMYGTGDAHYLLDISETASRLLQGIRLEETKKKLEYSHAAIINAQEYTRLSV
ncbi:MAG: GAF domain-containing protein, partial [Thiolinea sp.]